MDHSVVYCVNAQSTLKTLSERSTRIAREDVRGWPGLEERDVDEEEGEERRGTVVIDLIRLPQYSNIGRMSPMKMRSWATCPAKKTSRNQDAGS